MAFIFKRVGSKNWFAGWKDNRGKRVNRSTKIPHTPYKAENTRHARKIADEYEEASKVKRTQRQVRETISELSEMVSGEKVVRISLEDYMKSFLKLKHVETSQRTCDAYKTTFKGFRVYLGVRAGEDITDITKADVVGYRDSIFEKLSPATVQNKMKLLRALFSSAKQEGVTLENPTEGIKIVLKDSTAKKGKRAFEIDEVKRIMAVANDEWRSMILFGLYTGQRLGDLATLTWANLDLEKGWFTVSTQKTGKAINIPIHDSLLKHIKSLTTPIKQGQYVHPTLANLYTAGGTTQKSSGVLSNQFTSILIEAGLRKPVSHRKKVDGEGRSAKREASNLGFHCLRVTAITMLHNAKIPQAIVEQWVGHNSPEVHRRYVKMGEENLRKASNSLPKL